MSFSQSPVISSTTMRRRPERAEPCALIPDRREPVGADGRGKRAARDVPEVPCAGGRDHAAIDLARHELHDLERVGAGLRKRPSECLGDVVQRVPGEDGALLERVEEVARDLGGPPEELALVAHAASSCSKRAGSSNGPTSAR